MIVLDASAILEFLLKTPVGHAVAARIFASPAEIYAPHLLDLEATQVLRRLTRSGAIAAERCRAALDLLAGIRITRYPHYPLLPRIWQLRNNLTAYDAAYIALAELLDAPLLTHDGKLASASGHGASIELI